MKKDGGAAFPVVDAKYGYEGEHLGLECSDEGMSLRDYFAGQALTGYISSGGPYNLEADTKFAYAYADAMLKARREAGE
jgi:hypothetical protein